MRIKLTIFALVAVGLVTGGTYFLVRSSVMTKVRKSERRNLKGSFASAWVRLEMDGHEVVRRADGFARMSRERVLDFREGQEDLSDYLTAKVAAVPVVDRPDMVLVIVRGRILAAYVAPVLAGKKGAAQWLNRNFESDLSKKIFATELKKKSGAPASQLVPAGWATPDVLVGAIKKVGPLNRALPTGAAAPVIVPLVKKSVPSANGSPKRLGALVLGWSSKHDTLKAQQIATAMAADSVFRMKKFWRAYVALRVRLAMELVPRIEDELIAVGRVPDLVAMVDGNGVVLFRNKKTEYLVGQSLTDRYLSLKSVLAKGNSQSDIWVNRDLISPEMAKGSKANKQAAHSNERNTLLRVGMAPIFGRDGNTVACLIIGWALSDKAATQLAQNLGTSIVFLEGDRYAASSTDLSVVPSDIIKKIKSHRIEAKKISAADGTVEWENLKGISVVVEGKRYLAAAGVIAGSYKPGAYSFLVFVHTDEEEAPFRIVPWAIWGLGLLSLVIALVVMQVMWMRFVRPIDEIYNGVNEVISGDLEYSFGVPSVETEGLCYSLNGMLAKLLGRPDDEEDEEEGGEQDQATIKVKLGPLPPSVVNASDPSAAPLAAEGDEDHVRRIYKEYLAALDAEGDDLEGFTLDDFKAKVQVNERLLVSRYKCSKVRFRVETVDDEVVLSPVPIA